MSLRVVPFDLFNVGRKRTRVSPKETSPGVSDSAAARTWETRVSMSDFILSMTCRSIQICGGRSFPSETSRLRCSVGTTSIRSRRSCVAVLRVDCSSWRRPLSFPSSTPPSSITGTIESSGFHTSVWRDIAFLCCLMRGHFISLMTRLCVERIAS